MLVLAFQLTDAERLTLSERISITDADKGAPFRATTKCGIGSTRQVRVDPHAHGLRRENGMPEATARKTQARRDVVALPIGEFFDHLLRRQPNRQQIEDITHPNSHPADTGTPATLVEVHCDAVH